MSSVSCAVVELLVDFPSRARERHDMIADEVSIPQLLDAPLESLVRLHTKPLMNRDHLQIVDASQIARPFAAAGRRILVERGQYWDESRILRICGILRLCRVSMSHCVIGV